MWHFGFSWVWTASVQNSTNYDKGWVVLKQKCFSVSSLRSPSTAVTHWTSGGFSSATKTDLWIHLSSEVLQEKHEREGSTKYWEYSTASIKSAVEKESDSRYLVMREPRFSSAHTHSWTPHRDPTTTKSKPPHSAHIASSHWVTGTLSKARGKRVVKNVSPSAPHRSQPAAAQMYFWGAPIGWVHSMNTGFFRSSLGAEWFTESSIFERSFELLNVYAFLFLHTHINNRIPSLCGGSLWYGWRVNDQWRLFKYHFKISWFFFCTLDLKSSFWIR